MTERVTRNVTVVGACGVRSPTLPWPYPCAVGARVEEARSFAALMVQERPAPLQAPRNAPRRASRAGTLVLVAMVHLLAASVGAALLWLLLRNLTEGYLTLRDKSADPAQVQLAVHPCRIVDKSEVVALVTACGVLVVHKLLYGLGSLAALCAKDDDALVDALVRGVTQRLVVAAVTTGALMNTALRALEAVVQLHADARAPQHELVGFWDVVAMWWLVIAVVVCNAASEAVMHFTPAGATLPTGNEKQ